MLTLLRCDKRTIAGLKITSFEVFYSAVWLVFLHVQILAAVIMTMLLNYVYLCLCLGFVSQALQSQAPYVSTMSSCPHCLYVAQALRILNRLPSIDFANFA